MKKFLATLLVAVLVFGPFAKADEGMWFLAFINKNYKQMKAMGFKLSPKDIYDINHSSMKDAVVVLDHNQCTAEIVSAKGLLFTNHHCGVENVQAHSTVEHDYLKDGFWARTMEEELPNPGKSVTFLVRMEDVSDKINAELNDKMTEDEREMTIRKISERIEKEAIGETQYEAKVTSFFNGNNFYLFIYETFRDIRLVGVPPSSIGKFGGETDNWMWPRQTGDFCIFRIYCGPDGKPADYSPNNVPYKPKHFFPISLKGVKNNDFAMIIGYPGATYRNLPSWGIQEKMENENSVRIEVSKVREEILKRNMDKSDDLRIKYSDKFFYSANFSKKSLGENKALVDLKVLDKKVALEKEFTKWIEAKKEKRTEKYGDVLETIKNAYNNRKEIDKVRNYWFEIYYFGSEMFKNTYELMLLQYYQNSANDPEAAKESLEKIKGSYKNFDKNVDKELFVALLTIYRDKVPKNYHPDFFETIEKDYGSDIQKFADYLYENSVLTSSEKMLEFVEKPDMTSLQNDLGYSVASMAWQTYFGFGSISAPFEQNLEKGLRKFTAGWIEMETEKDKNKLYYPDANSTIRLSYGKVGGYKVGDKVFDYTTDLESLIKKEDPKNDEFIVPEKLKELYQKKDYGQYGQNGKMTVCFITNNDITGGNSGSPVLNGNGELIGIAFDGNWESLSSDIAFDKNLQKTINVDIRYVLFIIEKFAGAKNLIDEMVLVKN
jgi:hypothetical protein